MRAVLDTSILTRAFIKPFGTVRPVLNALEAGAYTAIYSDELLAEYGDVLRRPRMRLKYGITEEVVVGFLELLATQADYVVPTRRITVCRDPKDNMVLEAAVAGSADVIVSGDEDLLVLNPFERILIVGPSALLRMLRY